MDVRVGVLCGGTSPERQGSLASGRAACRALHELDYEATVIDLADVAAAGLAERIDVALIAAHGPGGEDGKLQGLLEWLQIPYTGSGVLASAIGMHKPMLKDLATSHVATPDWHVVDGAAPVEETVMRVEAELGWPVVVKPASGGGSRGVVWADTGEALARVLGSALRSHYALFFVERFVRGRFCTVGILDIEDSTTVLPVLDIATDRHLYDRAAKTGRDRRVETCPSQLPTTVVRQLEDQALQVHRRMGAHGVNRIDFIVDSEAEVPYLLEANTAPGLRPDWNLAVAAQAGGVAYPELIERILHTAFTKTSYVP